MRTASALRASAETDPGLQRDVNEDRVYADASRGVFIVIDGVGGHAAGGKAADIALAMMRTRLERETGSIVDRVREAIAIANNEIHRAAGLRAGSLRMRACSRETSADVAIRTSTGYATPPRPIVTESVLISCTW